MSKPPKILLIYIEPTPYIIELINAIYLTWPGQVDTLFLTENLTQNWDMKLDERFLILPKQKIAKFRLLYQIFLKNNYDFIHFAGWGNSFLLLIIFIAKMFRFPITVESDTPLPHEISLWKKTIKKMIYPVFFKLFHLVLPGGTRQANYFKHYFVASKRIFPVQMTVDVAGIKQYAEKLSNSDRHSIRAQYGIKDEHIVFLFVGRLVLHKGLNELISAFSRIKNNNCRLLIVGDGPMRQQVEETIKINKNICYAGRLTNNELINIYFASDVFVLPSHIEPWGLVINEAMSLGLPLIVTDRVGCVDDLVEHQQNGIIIKAECVQELKSAMEEMTSNEKRTSMRTKSLQKIANWTIENEAKLLCQAWQQLKQA